VDVFQLIVRTKLIRKYLVNIRGNETDVLSGASLWKLSSGYVDETSRTDIVGPADYTKQRPAGPSVIASSITTSADTAASPPPPPPPPSTSTNAKERAERKGMTLNEKMIRVQQLISEIWELPVEEQHRAFNKLYLTWHPDRNRGDERDCSEVFKFIHSEMETGPPKKAAPTPPKKPTVPQKSSVYFSSPSTPLSTSSASYFGSVGNNIYSENENNRNEWWSNFNAAYNARRTSTSSRKHLRKPRSARTFSNGYPTTSSSSSSSTSNSQPHWNADAEAAEAEEAEIIQCNHGCPFCCPEYAKTTKK